MAENIFDNPDLLLRYYQTQAEELQWRFQAIWEAMRHYTWLLSILLAGWPVVAFINKDLNTIKTSLRYLVIAPVLGLFFSIIGYFVISKAYDFYNVLEARLFYIEKVLGLTSQEDFLDSRRKEAAKHSSVESYVKTVRPIITIRPIWKVRIRALFLFGLIIFAVVAILEIVFCLVY